MTDEATAACSGKRRFPKFLEARREAKRLGRHKELAANAYHCAHCHGFHIGSPAIRQKRRRNADTP